MVLAGGGLLAGCNETYRNAANNVHEIKEKISGNLDVKYLRQVMTSDPSTSRTIMWQADSAMSSPEVEVKLKNSDDTKKFSAVDSTFTDDGHENIQYTAKIENLSPGSEYEYRILNGENATDFLELKTPSNEKFKAIIFPDSQSADYEVWSATANPAFERNPDAEFFLNLGDIVDNGEDRTQWQSWMNKVDKHLRRLPFAPVHGNHETYSRDWKVRESVAYLNYFAVPENGSENFSRHYYSFDFGPAHCVVLNSQWDEIDTLRPGILEEQKNWLRRDMESTSKTWKIIFIHKDVLQYRINGRPERLEGFSETGTEFMPEFESLGADVVFTAHLHTYRNRGRLKNFVEDESGPLYILTGVSGDVRYPGLWIDHELDKVVAPQPETDNYLTLEVDEKNLTAKCFLPDGTQIDETTLSKA